MTVLGGDGVALSASTRSTPALGGVLDGGDLPNSPPTIHGSSLGVGQVVSSGATMRNVCAGSRPIRSLADEADEGHSPTQRRLVY